MDQFQLCAHAHLAICQLARESVHNSLVSQLFPLLQERAAAAGDFSAPAPIRHFPLLSGGFVGAGEGGEAQSAGGLYSSLFLA